jgi:type IV pilus assembly protein PilC
VRLRWPPLRDLDMSTYVFKAIDLAGVKARGEVEADSKQAVSDQLKQRGLIVLDIADKHSSKNIEITFMQRVKPTELAIFARQLSTMISSGMSILRALYVLEEQTESKLLTETIVAVRKDVEAGLSLSDSMARHPKVFNPLFVAMTQAGETGGVLEDALVRVADQLQKDAALRKQVKSAMVYPALVVFFAVGVMMALVAFLVPVFENVFKEFGGELPAMTQVSVLMSEIVTQYWWAMFGGTALFVVAFIKWKKSTWGRRQWDHFRLHVPMRIGTIVQQIAVARWSRTLASLTAAGVPLLQALEITGRTGGNVAVEEAMDGVIGSVKRGGTIAAPLAQAPIFPTMVTHMVGVGEETGALDAMLDRVAEFYEEQVEASVKTLTSILEPIMIILIGAIVGFIVISMYLPLFEIYNHIE